MGHLLGKGLADYKAIAACPAGQDRIKNMNARHCSFPDEKTVSVFHLIWIAISRALAKDNRSSPPNTTYCIPLALV